MMASVRDWLNSFLGHGSVFENDVKHILDSDAKLRAKSRLRLQALHVFIDSYPGEWEKIIHEGGCVGTQSLPNERYGHEECTCDGDYNANLIRRALR